jgi:dihydroorotase-like cyclic amidohydrolase
MGIHFVSYLYLTPSYSISSPHVHLNEPGRTAWEGFWTGTRAASAGGITTLVDMPLNSIPPTTTVPNLDEKRHAAQGQCHTDIAFWGGVIPGNQVRGYLTLQNSFPDLLVPHRSI